MNNFTFYSPTKVIFGKNAHLATADEIKNSGGSRVMIVYGGGSVEKSGLLDILKQLLSDKAIPFTVLGGVQPNPRLSLAKAGIEQAIGFKADFILAVGGGSVIDTAKAIAHGAANPNTDIWMFWSKQAIVDKSLPVGVVLTIAAAGSETSDSAVLTNDKTGEKRGLNTEFNRPKFAVMNPEFANTLPKYQIMCGVVDIIMHTLERYFTPEEGNEATDEIAEALMRVVIKNGRIIIENPSDYQAMSEIMWCGSISHNGITGLGGVSGMPVHQFGHELSGKFDVAHGASLSAIWGSWAKYCCSARPDRFARFARKVWGIGMTGVEEAALSGITKTVSYFAEIGAPTCFTELGIGLQSEETLRELADKCVFYGKRTVGLFKPLDSEDVYQVYKMANR